MWTGVVVTSAEDKNLLIRTTVCIVAVMEEIKREGKGERIGCEYRVIEETN